MLIHKFTLILLVIWLASCSNTQNLNTSQFQAQEAEVVFDGNIENVDVRCEKLFVDPPFHFVEGMKHIDAIVAVKKKGLYALGSAYTGKGRDGDMNLIHFDKKLKETWRKAYEENSVEWGTEIRYHEDHLYALATRFTNGKADNDVYVIKTDLAGEKIWSKTSGTPNYDVGNDFTIHNEQVFVSGRTVKSLIRDPFILKTDGLTDSLSIQATKGKNIESFIEQYADSLFFVSSIFEGDEREKWLELACYDLDLNELWRHKVTDLSGDRPTGQMLITQAGDIYLMGHLGVDKYGYQILIAKVSLQGQTEWIKTYGLLNEGQSMGRIDMGQFILESADQGVVIGGNTGSLYGSGINYLFEINETGNPVWAKGYINPNGYLSSISYEPTSEQYILGGYYRQTLSSDEVSKGFLLALDRTGEIVEK
ncbi:MAG: hypothetical protein AB8H47_16040 [Bacteroidia bacterium]